MDTDVLKAIRDDIEGERGRLIEAMVSRNKWTIEETHELAALQGAVAAMDAELAMPPKPAAPTGPRVEFGEDGWPKE